MSTLEPSDDGPVLSPGALAGLRVLAIADDYGPAASGGAERAAHEIYRRIAAAGASVHVISTTTYDPFVDDGVEVEVIRGISLSKLVGAHMVFSPRVFRRLFRRARTGDWDVLHINTIHYTGCFAAALAARRYRLPLVTTAQLGDVSRLPLVPRLFSQVYEHSIGRLIVRSSAAVLAVSGAVKDHVQTIGARPERVSVVENGVEHERFSMPPVPARSTPPVIVAIGRLMSNKGPELLVEASAELSRRGLEFSTVFIGDGPLRQALEQRVAELGVGDRVRFVGQVTDVERRLADADIVVRASYTEGLPLAVLEAMAAGRCNVVSDIPPNCELIEHERNGLRFRAGDSGSLADQLERAVSDPEFRARSGAAAQRDAKRRSWDRMAAETAAALIATQDSRARA